MTTQNESQPTLDDVLEQYAAEGPGYETLNDYVRRFPEHVEALSDFTVQWSAMEHAEASDTPDGDPDVEASLAAIRSLIRHKTATEPTADAEVGAVPTSAVPQLASPAGDAPADSLEDMLARLGIDAFAFENQSRLDYSVLVNLSTGGFTFDSPEQKECVAREILHHIRALKPDPVPSLPAVERSISMPLMIVAGQSSSPNRKPEASTKPFRKGIEDARDMTDEAKQAWLRILDEAC